jgi:hypothetical protein
MVTAGLSWHIYAYTTLREIFGAEFDVMTVSASEWPPTVQHDPINLIRKIRN